MLNAIDDFFETEIHYSRSFYEVWLDVNLKPKSHAISHTDKIF